MNREDYPRVSDILNMIYPFPEDRYRAWAFSQGLSPDWITAESQRIGTKIHNWIQNRVEGIEKWADLPAVEDIEEGCLKAIDKLLHDYDILESEVKVYNDEWEYRGTLDAIGKLKGTDEMLILDWKTYGAWKGEYKRDSGKIKKLATQLSMYKEAYGKPYPAQGIIIKADGDYEVEMIKDNDKWKEFMKKNKLSPKKK